MGVRPWWVSEKGLIRREVSKPGFCASRSRDLGERCCGAAAGPEGSEVPSREEGKLFALAHAWEKAHRMGGHHPLASRPGPGFPHADSVCRAQVFKWMVIITCQLFPGDEVTTQAPVLPLGGSPHLQPTSIEGTGHLLPVWGPRELWDVLWPSRAWCCGYVRTYWGVCA